MKLLVDGIIYDSTETPILIEFDENEQDIFNMRRFVSAPEDSTVEEREELINRKFEEKFPEVYIILSATQPEIVDFTYFTDKETASKRVEELNKLAKKREYWFITLYGNFRNL